MLIKITIKDSAAPKSLYNHLKWHADKIIQRVPRLSTDLSQFDFLLRKSSHKFITKKGGILEFYEGTINLNLPQDRLHIDFEGRSPDECIDKGIELLKKELKKYKDKHFKSDSHYPDHRSIRGKI